MTHWYIHLLLSTLTLLVMAPIAGLGVHEWIRWQDCSAKCQAKQRDSEKFVNMDACQNRYGQHVRDSPMDKACTDAYQALTITVFECTARDFWKTSGLAHLYAQVAENTVALLILETACALFIIHKIFTVSWCGKREKVEKKKKKEELPPPPALPAPVIQYVPIPIQNSFEIPSPRARKRRAYSPVRLYDE